MRRIFILLTIIISCVTLSSCGDGQEKSAGEELLSGKYKVKSVVNIKGVDNLLEFECYIDGGNGKGLLQYGDDVYDVIIAENAVYVEVSEVLTVKITDLTGHFYIPSAQVPAAEKISDLQILGFVYLDSTVAGYKGSVENISVETQYGSSDVECEPVSLSVERSISSASLASLLEENKITADIGVTTTQTTDDGDKNEEDEEEPEKTVESFYNNFRTGVQIQNQIFSISDTCDPSTYFFNEIPEGVSQKIEYSQDNRVTVKYVSYLLKDGRTTFATVADYVRSIYTTSYFRWCGITYGMTKDELEEFCGENLTKKEREETGFKISFDGLEFIDKTGKTYLFEIGELTGEVTLGKENTVESLYVRRTLEYEMYSSGGED